MTRFQRLRFILLLHLSVAGVLAAALIGWGWVRSYRAQDLFVYSGFSFGGGHRTFSESTFRVESGRGGLELRFSRATLPMNRPDDAEFVVRQALATQGWDHLEYAPPTYPSPVAPEAAAFERFGFAFTWSRRDPRIPFVEFIAPYPLWLALVLLPPLHLGRKMRRARRASARRARGLCWRCGYDLRGATGACPECGEPAPPVQNVGARGAHAAISLKLF